MKYKEQYENWLKNATIDPDLYNELKEIKNDDDAISDRFYKELEFGTGGLRGVIGAGTNRMNVYTVAKTSQGIADYINSVKQGSSVAISYDSRIKSELFAKTAASVFAANGIHVYIYKELMPTPCLSYAVRYYKCQAGVMVTASHNPAKYNGYKAYGPDGCQLGLEESERVLDIMNRLDIFADIKWADFDLAFSNGDIECISNECIQGYLDCVMEQSVAAGVCEGSDLSVIYTPLHGAGNKPVRAILEKIGIKDVRVVEKQELPDGNFPTLPFPNPEFKEAFSCAIEICKQRKADVLIATDPDCDRVGIAVPKGEDFVLFTGNQVGVLLLNYILSVKTELGTLEKDPVAVKTIVTTDMCNPIAKKYGCKMIDVLTGFKFIGEQIAILEQKGQQSRYQLGFEESYGYLKGSYVRDKDAVVASMLICEMACYYKKQGKTLIDVFKELENEFGVYHNSQQSFTFEGQKGMQIMKDIMINLASNPPSSVANYQVLKVGDYNNSVFLNTKTKELEPITLPKADVLSFILENGHSVVIRPSGTEPKIKIYVTSTAPTRELADGIADEIKQDFKKLMGVE